MLFLGERDIVGAVSFPEIVEAVASAMVLYEKKAFHMPPRVHVDDGRNTLLLMPCFSGRVFGTKLVSLFPGNAEKGLPVLRGAMILNDGGTGEPLALLDAAVLTALRTGAVGGVGIRYLTGEGVATLGIVGAGVQGFYQALFGCTERKFSDVVVFDLLPEKVAAFCQKFLGYFSDVQIHRVSRVEDLLEKSQVVITATNALEPVLPDREELLEGKCFVGIGSYKPTMREFPETLFRLLDRVFLDTEHAVEESGDVIDPLKNGWIRRNRIVTLGKVITGEEKIVKGGTRLFKSVGMALFDLVVSELIYRQALQKGLGQEITL